MRSMHGTARSRTGIWAALALAVALAAIASVLLVVRGSSGGDADPAAVGLPQHQGGHAGAAGQEGTLQGRSGAAGAADSGPQPVTEVDRTFLVKVRQAGLWEIPAGRLAQTHASSDAVRRAGLHLLDGHSKLDQLVREDADILGVELPNEATAEQQQWVTQLDEARGDEFDRLFANVLRASHGKIFATIGEVRAATQNDLIRRHARQANQTVLDHMEVLEDTGLVTPDTLREVESAVTPK
ncbi:DUF4142 domain-containing protein [Streptomyces sp. NPDC002889]|uniref:DUF4142 domain-containing protein n=1 Tax=Streptomyces sp. NPDC002889 TaxID=3364669 RepID=UPI0036A979AA